MFDQAAIRKHIEDGMSASKISLGPFPHLIVENFFPAAIYERILAYNPFRWNPGKEWLSKARSAEVSAATPYFARKQINFHGAEWSGAPPDQKDFWERLEKCLLEDRWFDRLVAGKFPEYFSLRFGDLAQDEDIFSLLRSEMFLQRHEPGYCIGPHTDIPTRIFTCIFSFADREGFEEYGTQLLKPDDRMARCWGNDHYKPDGFTVSKTAPYRPNNFLLFFKTRHSFHAVKAIDDTVPNQRYGMQYQLYEPHGGLFRDLSAPDLMRTGRKGMFGAGKRLARSLGKAMRG